MKKVTLIIFVLFFLSYILPLGVRPMVMPDETRYAEISREMLNTGDWIVPKVDGLRYFEKPVLGHWLNAASQYLFGQNAFAVRLPSALAVGFSAFAIFFFVRRFAGGAQAGLLAAATFLTCLEVFAIGVFCVLDSVFSLFITATLVTFYFGWTEGASRKKCAFLALSGMFCGLAFLTKGFLAFILPAMVILPLAIWERRWKDLPAFCWMPLVVAVLVALPWSVAIYFREPDFWHYFFFTEHIERFIAADGGQHPEPFWFYVPILAGGALPWTPVFPLVIVGLKKTQLKDPFLRFLLCWLIFPFLFFSACEGKLGTYILPCYPPVSILTAVGLLRIFHPSAHHQTLAALSRNLRNSAVILFVIAAVLVLIQFVGPILPKLTKWGPIIMSSVRIYDHSEIWKCAIVVIALITYGLLLLHASDAEKLEKKLILWYLGPVLLMFGSHFAVPDRFLYNKTPDEFLLRNQHRIHPDTVLVSDNYLTPAVCFCYKRSDVFIVDRGGEFTYGLGYDDSKQRQLDIDELGSRDSGILPRATSDDSRVLITSMKRYVEYRKKLPKPIFEDMDHNFVFVEFGAQDSDIGTRSTSDKPRAADQVDFSGPLVCGFIDPPKAARPSIYWLWLNGYVNRDYLETELKQFSEKGIGGLCIFDMGARGDAGAVPPAGPAFMSDEFVDNVAYALKLAGKFDLDVELAACSSWDLGGSWVLPQHASMGLYHTKISVNGPIDYDGVLPLPELPSEIPRTPDGKPAFIKNVAVLAIPESTRQPAHEFIFKLPGTDAHRIDHVVLYNAQSDNPERYGKFQLFAKDFSVAVSADGPEEKSSKEIIRDRLKPNTEPQRFDFDPVDARYVRLRIYNGYNTDFDMVQLAEFEVYDTAGHNIVASKEIDRTKDTAQIVLSNSQRAPDSKWSTDNLNDGQKSGPNGTWLSAGPPPLVIEDRSKILDITKQVNTERKLEWKVPPGEWTIIRFVCANTGEKLKVPSPNSDGLATDHFSREATREFIQYITNRLNQKLGNLKLTPLKQLYLPSYEVRGATWTPDFIEQFEKYCHYDMTPYLPALAGCIIENQDITSRFLYDYRKMLGDLLVDAYYRTASETAHEAGLGIEAEAGGPGPPVHQVPVDALKALGSIDEMRGEFWPWRQERNQLWVVKETACAAHIYGRKLVNMESFTGFRHWQDGPFDLKPVADRAFCEGMNHVVWHTSSHQPPEAGKPGWVYGAGTHLTPNITWWSKAKPFIDYLSRCSFMLQQGHFVADVCYYYGDQGFNFVPAKHIDPSLGYGYDYDVVNTEVILSRMSIKDGRLVLPDGMRYELLVLPDRKDMNLQVLEKIKELVADGGTVVGPKPTQSNGLTDYPTRYQQVKQLADLLWGNCDGKDVFEHRYGKGKIVWGRSLREILLSRGVGPDFHYTSNKEQTDLDFIHRQTTDTEIYFIRNRNNRREFVNAHFRVSSMTPEFWLPDTGTILQQLVYEQTPEGISVPLELAPFGSLFVVFRKPVSRPHLVSLGPGIVATTVTEKEVRVTAFENGSYKMKTSDGRTIEFEIEQIPTALQLTGPWDVHFPAGWGAPETVTLTALKSWTEHENPGIRNFSGTACYKKEFVIPQQWFNKGSPVRDTLRRKIYLDLGKLWALGEVTLNGQSLGIVWKPPYRVEITKAAVAGQNKHEIEITNTWANRLVGDAQLPPEKRFCRTNITSSGTPSKPWKDIPLRESGLLGPVELIQAVEKTISLTK